MEKPHRSGAMVQSFDILQIFPLAFRPYPLIIFANQKIIWDTFRMTTPRLLISLCCLSILTACTMSQTFKGQTVTVDGMRFLVTNPKGEPNFYGAMLDNTLLEQGGVPRPVNNARNVRAIEAVTGCPVDLASVTHKNGFTTASVSCPEGTSPKY